MAKGVVDAFRQIAVGFMGLDVRELDGLFASCEVFTSDIQILVDTMQSLSDGFNGGLVYSTSLRALSGERVISRRIESSYFFLRSQPSIQALQNMEPQLVHSFGSRTTRVQITQSKDSPANEGNLSLS